MERLLLRDRAKRPDRRPSENALGSNCAATACPTSRPLRPRRRPSTGEAKAAAAKAALAKQRASLEAIREFESRAHESEVRQLKSAFEERLTEAVEKVRAVHATNRDAVAILQKNKKLRMEVSKLKHDSSSAVEAQKDAEARERQRAEEGAAVVQQLMSQLQEKEALLAAGAGAMSEDDREEMMQKERKRAQQAAEKEKKRIEAAMAEERGKAMEKLTALQAESAETKRLLEESRLQEKDATRALEKEKRAKEKATEAKNKLEAAWKAEESKRERLAKLEVSVNTATKQITTALGSIRKFLEATDQHLKVDTHCLACLQPLIEPQVLVPCGHSICLKCAQALDANATMTEDGPAKFCPLCAQIKLEDAEDGGRGKAEAADEVAPVEPFPNQMLDAVTTRLRAKSLDVQALLAIVNKVFPDGTPQKAAVEKALPEAALVPPSTTTVSSK